MLARADMVDEERGRTSKEACDVANIFDRVCRNAVYIRCISPLHRAASGLRSPILMLPMKAWVSSWCPWNGIPWVSLHQLMRQVSDSHL